MTEQELEAIQKRAEPSTVPYEASHVWVRHAYEDRQALIAEVRRLQGERDKWRELAVQNAADHHNRCHHSLVDECVDQVCVATRNALAKEKP